MDFPTFTCGPNPYTGMEISPTYRIVQPDVNGHHRYIWPSLLIHRDKKHYK